MRQIFVVRSTIAAEINAFTTNHFMTFVNEVFYLGHIRIDRRRNNAVRKHDVIPSVTVSNIRTLIAATSHIGLGRMRGNYREHGSETCNQKGFNPTPARVHFHGVPYLGVVNDVDQVRREINPDIRHPWQRALLLFPQGLYHG